MHKAETSLSWRHPRSTRCHRRPCPGRPADLQPSKEKAHGSIASALIPVVQNYGVILLLRFVQGWGCMVTVTSAVVSSWFPTRERGLAIGVLLGAIGLGSALGGYVAGVLTPAIGWQNTFWLISAATGFGAALFYALVRQRHLWRRNGRSPLPDLPFALAASTGSPSCGCWA
ncbi:MFS transporter [Saccharopolyspora hattusasensis]|uniref:MFS transporter n=1 Tax=Saccharopolyspora hattusasensis TaxID=1128679 RepID=UPI003D98319F